MVKAGQIVKVNIMGSICKVKLIHKLGEGYWKCQPLGLSFLSYSKIHENQILEDK